MPFALTLVGLILIITGFQNTYREFGKQVQGDFTGPDNFLYWLASIGIIGGLGYVKGLESFSRSFMVLILVALVVKMFKDNPQIFSSFGTGIATGSATPVDNIGAPLSGGATGATSGGGFNLSNIGQDVSIVSTLASL